MLYGSPIIYNMYTTYMYMYLFIQELQAAERARRAAEGERDELQEELPSLTGKLYVHVILFC